MLESQLPVLVLLLVVGGSAKLATVRAEAKPGALTHVGPSVFVPDRFRTPVVIAAALGELALAGLLLITGHPFVRWVAVVFFALTTYVLWELRRRRPDAGCGCFGEVSAAPVGLRSIGRTVLLTGMALVSVWSSGSGWSAVTHLTWWTLGGLAAIALLSPELEETFDRIRYRAPCEQRRVPEGVMLGRLKSSAPWRAHRDRLLSPEPYDSWRELCWRFYVFESQEKTDVVFAVYLSGWRPAVRVAEVSADDSGSMQQYSTILA